MTTSTLRSSRVWLVRSLSLFALFSLAGPLPSRAAQEKFWPFNLFPPQAWTLSSTDATPTSVNVPTVGLITSRRFNLLNLGLPIHLPGLSNSAVLSSSSTIFNSETSLDSGANWAPYTGSGATSLTLRHTNGAPGVRHLELELSFLNIPVNGSYGAANVRTSPTQASVGELVVTATNGGFTYAGFVNLVLEVSVDNGDTWFAFSPAAYLEVAGPTATPTRLAVSRSDAMVTICWRTEAAGEYQLQRTRALDGSDWVNLGLLQAGTGAEVCVTEELDAGLNQFYRLQLSP